MKNIKTKIINLNREGHGESNPTLLRIILHPDYTKIDFGYSAIEIFQSGGWIRIDPFTFIEIIELNQRLTLVRAVGIPLSPIHLSFESNKDWQYYSLYFPPIPQKNCTLNIIEIEKGTLNDFNYYNIAINMTDALEILDFD